MMFRLMLQAAGKSSIQPETTFQSLLAPLRILLLKRNRGYLDSRRVALVFQTLSGVTKQPLVSECPR